MKVLRNGDKVSLEYRYQGLYIRRSVSLDALTIFLNGEQPAESNLCVGQEPMTFEKFCDKTYLPMNARHRLKDSSYQRELGLIHALKRFFSKTKLHEITRKDWEEYKDQRLSGRLSAKAKPCAQGTVLKEFKCLRTILQYATDMELIQRNVLSDIKKPGLVDGNRAEVWLTKDEIKKLLPHFEENHKLFAEFRIWTGARPGEASQFGRENINWERGEISLLNSKQKKGSRRLTHRYLKIKSLGPRFEELLKSLVPHPVSRLFFCHQDTGKPYSRIHLARVFKKALQKSGINKKAVAYDLRGTFAVHRAMVVRNFRQLQVELGHASPESIQHYLNQATHFDPKESIFYGIEGLK